MARAISDNSSQITLTITKTVREMLQYAAKKQNMTLSNYMRTIINNHLHQEGLLENVRDGLIERGAPAMFTHASPAIQKLRKKVLQERMEHARKYISKQAPKHTHNAKPA